MLEQALIVSSILLWVVVLFNLLLTLALVRKINRPSYPEGGLKRGTPAPEFTAETLSGEKVNLATYGGRSVAFIFVSPHCNPCRSSMPSYEALYLKAKEAGVDLVLVSTGEAAETHAFVDEFKTHLPVLVAPQPSNSFMNDYKATGTPAYCLLDEKGKVISSGYPSRDMGPWKELADAWEKGRVRTRRLVPAN